MRVRQRRTRLPTALAPANAVGRVARVARGDGASTRARPWCVRPASRSPTATLLLLLVASLLAMSLMLHCYCALVMMSDKITMAAACWSWYLSISNSSIKVHLARASSLDTRRPRRRGQNAGWAAHRRYPAAQGRVAGLVFRVDQPVLRVENGLLKIFRLVCGSSAQAPSCWLERRRQLRCAAAAGRLRRVVARVTSLHHSLLALEPQHGPS